MRNLLYTSFLVFLLTSCTLITNVEPATKQPTPSEQPTHPQKSSTKLLFGQFDDNYQVYTYTIDIDGTNLKQLSNHGITNPSWSPDGKQIVYGCTGICIITLNGGQTTSIKVDATNGYPDEPAWSPDGKQFVFLGSQSYNSFLYLANIDGSGQRLLAKNFEMGETPLWSPDSKHIIFRYHRLDFAFNLGIANTESSSPQFTQVNESKHENWMCAVDANCPDDIDPTWSPVSNQIAYVQKRERVFNVCLAGLDGVTQKCLTENTNGGYSPTWSPDGTKIAFLSERNGHIGIYTINIDGSNQTLLKNELGLVRLRCLRWSPDGQKFVFLANEEKKTYLYVLNIKDSRLTKVADLHLAAYDCPQWQP